MKTYIKSIQFAQKLFLSISILMMLILPIILSFYPELISDETTLLLYDLSHITVFFVMIVRPLADIFTKTNLIRPLVILRKGVGVFSASIIISFIFSKIIVDPVGYFTSLATIEYWSFTNYALFAHLADISAVILLITSNNYSKRILASFWKPIQKLSYVYYYSSSFYVLMISQHYTLLASMFIVTLLTMWAYIKNVEKRNLMNQNQAQNLVQNTIQG